MSGLHKTIIMNKCTTPFLIYWLSPHCGTQVYRGCFGKSKRAKTYTLICHMSTVHKFACTAKHGRTNNKPDVQIVQFFSSPASFSLSELNYGVLSLIYQSHHVYLILMAFGFHAACKPFFKTFFMYVWDGRREIVDTPLKLTINSPEKDYVHPFAFSVRGQRDMMYDYCYTRTMHIFVTFIFGKTTMMREGTTRWVIPTVEVGFNGCRTSLLSLKALPSIQICR